MKTTPVLIVHGTDNSFKMELTGHLPPGAGKNMGIKINAIRHVLIDLTDGELEDLIYIANSNANEYRAVLIDLLDSHPDTFSPQ